LQRCHRSAGAYIMDLFSSSLDSIIDRPLLHKRLKRYASNNTMIELCVLLCLQTWCLHSDEVHSSCGIFFSLWASKRFCDAARCIP
jgi:hypothetical protein